MSLSHEDGARLEVDLFAGGLHLSAFLQVRLFLLWYGVLYLLPLYLLQPDDPFDYERHLELRKEAIGLKLLEELLQAELDAMSNSSDE